MKVIKGLVFFSCIVFASASLAVKRIKVHPYFVGKNACLIIYDLKKGEIIERYNPVRCDADISPESTFKIPLSLMAFDQHVINEKTQFKWDGQDKGMAQWNHDQSPASWIQNSVVWVSQLITPQLGMAKITHYLHAFGFGNADFSGDAGSENGLTYAWLDSSLKVSAGQEIQFLFRLLKNQLPVNKNAIDQTKQNMYLTTSPNGWKLYGKTGSSNFDNTKRPTGWFVGYTQKGDETYLFVLNFTDRAMPKKPYAGGLKAKQIAQTILKKMQVL